MTLLGGHCSNQVGDGRAHRPAEPDFQQMPVVPTQQQPPYVSYLSNISALPDSFHQPLHPKPGQAVNSKSGTTATAAVVDLSCSKHFGKAAGLAQESNSINLSSCSSDISISSIYDLFSRRQRWLMLAVVASAAALAPLADTVYIPSLYVIRRDLHTSQELAAATVAMYMFVVGLATLFWGPASDRYGRRPMLLSSTIMFVAFSAGCYFAPTVEVLIAMRACQGAAVASYGSTGNGVLADTWPPHLRGTALGMSTIPLLIGPLLGPVMGGGIAQAFGWRATFIAIIIISGAIILPLLIFGVPETHQYKNLVHLASKDPQGAAGVKEAPQILARVPQFQAPWYPFQILLDRFVILHALCTLVTFGSMFCSVTQLPVLLAQPPYSMSTGMIGVACLSSSAAGIVAAPLGGRLADFSAAVHGSKAHPLQRLLYNNTLNLILKPIGLLLYGWSAQFSLHLAVPLLGMFLIGVSNNLYLPGIFAFVTSYKQQEAAAAAAGIHSVMCLSSGVLIMCGAVAVQALGSGVFFSILAGLNVLASSAAALQIFKCSGVSNWQQLREFSSFKVSKDVLQELQMHAGGSTVPAVPPQQQAAAAAAAEVAVASPAVADRV